MESNNKLTIGEQVPVEQVPGEKLPTEHKTLSSPPEKVTSGDSFMDATVDQLTETVSKIVKDEQITTLNILSICINLMQVVEKYPKLTGNQKKELVLRALSNAVSKKGGDNALMALIPSFIDNAISIENSQVKISVNTSDVLSCCSGLLFCLEKQKK